jgi:cytidylate kinase
MKQRDLQDSTRAIAPLRQAEDAVLLDTSDMDLEQSIAAAKAIVLGKLEGK